jgi:proline-specific peptidase
MRTQIVELKKEYIETSDGVRLHVRDWGEGKPLLFLHGWPLSDEMYEYQFDELRKKGFRCIAFSLRGFGKSDQPDSGYSYDIFADDINTVLDDLGISQLPMIGFSMGGALAAYYASKYPERVSKLVLIGAAAPIWTQREDYTIGSTKADVDKLIELCNSNRMELLKVFEGIFTASEDSIPVSIKDWLHNLNMQASPIAMEECLKLLRDADLRQDLESVQVPTLILHGKKDKICPFEFSEEMRKRIKNSKVVPFENSGHAIFYEEKEKLNSELIKFLK